DLRRALFRGDHRRVMAWTSLQRHLCVSMDQMITSLVEEEPRHARFERNLCEVSETAGAMPGRGGRRDQTLGDPTRRPGRGVHRLLGHYFSSGAGVQDKDPSRRVAYGAGVIG